MSSAVRERRTARIADAISGAAASVIVVLIWIYYSAQIVFFGAEFTRAYTRRLGAAVEPEAFAERIGAPPAAECEDGARSA